MMRFLLSLCLLLLSLHAGATEPLSRDQVARFIDTLEALQAKREQTDDLSEQQGRQQTMALGRQYRDLIREHGFSLEEWSRVSQRVFQAYAALQMDGGEMEKGMREAEQQIRDNPNLSDQAKQQMLQAYEQQRRAMSQMNQSPDKAAVKPFAERLETLGD